LNLIPVIFIFIAIELLTTNKLFELACLALYLMYEKKQGKKSFWYPYIRELDHERGRDQLSVESPLLWSKSKLDYLLGSPVKVSPLGGAPKVHEELHGQQKWMKEWRQVGRHLQAMEGERGDRIS